MQSEIAATLYDPGEWGERDKRVDGADIKVITKAAAATIFIGSFAPEA